MGKLRRLTSRKQPSAKVPVMHRMLNHMASPASTNIPSNPTRGNAICVTLKARAPPLTANIAIKRMTFGIVWLGGDLILVLVGEPYHGHLFAGVRFSLKLPLAKDSRGSSPADGGRHRRRTSLTGHMGTFSPLKWRSNTCP
jgi:hypothetical protein